MLAEMEESTVNICEKCGEEIEQVIPGRTKKYCSTRCRVSFHRRQKRYNSMVNTVTERPTLNGQLVLELFPGAGMFGRAFESWGACVVRGPDVLYGHDVKCFKGILGKFDGIIAGPPCQFASTASMGTSKAENLIPEFLRIVEECKPTWAVMENVREAKPYAPDWDYTFLRDWDCGGFTHRRRGFWFYGMDAPPKPAKRQGTPQYSILASSWKGGHTLKSMHKYVTPQQASRLQGFPDLADDIIRNQPGRLNKHGQYQGVTKRSRNVMAIHMLGNGVPFALGSYVASYVAYKLAFDRIPTN